MASHTVSTQSAESVPIAIALLIPRGKSTSAELCAVAVDVGLLNATLLERVVSVSKFAK